MAFEKGWKGGPGRPKGSRARFKNMLDAPDVCQEMDFHPIRHAINIARKPTTDDLTQLEICKWVQSYCAPSYKPIDLPEVEEQGESVEESGYDVAALEALAKQPN